MGEYCNEIEKLLSDYVDGDVDAETKAEIDQHMIDCPPCLDFLDSFRGVVAASRCCKIKEMPDVMRDRLRQFLATKLQDG